MFSSLLTTSNCTDNYCSHLLPTAPVKENQEGDAAIYIPQPHSLGSVQELSEQVWGMEWGGQSQME